MPDPLNRSDLYTARARVGALHRSRDVDTDPEVADAYASLAKARRVLAARRLEAHAQRVLADPAPIPGDVRDRIVAALLTAPVTDTAGGSR